MPSHRDGHGHDREHDHERRERHAGESRGAGRGNAARCRVHPDTEQHRDAEHHERHGPTRAAQREAEVGRGGELLERAPDQRRIVVRVRAHSDRDPDEQHDHEEGAVPPTHERGGEQCEDRQRVA